MTGSYFLKHFNNNIVYKSIKMYLTDELCTVNLKTFITLGSECVLNTQSVKPIVLLLSIFSLKDTEFAKDLSIFIL